MMPGPLRASLTSPETRPTTIGEYEIQRVLGDGYKGVTYEVKRRKGTGTIYALN